MTNLFYYLMGFIKSSYIPNCWHCSCGAEFYNDSKILALRHKHYHYNKDS